MWPVKSPEDPEGKWELRKYIEGGTGTFKVHLTAWQARKRAKARTQDRSTWLGQSGAVDMVERSEKGGPSEFRRFDFLATPYLSFPICEMGWYHLKGLW